MLLSEFLKAKGVVFGLEAPQFIWLAALGLCLWTGWQIARLWWLIRRERDIYQSVITQVAQIKADHGEQGRAGLSGAAYDALSRVFTQHRSLIPAWQSFVAQMVTRRDATEGERFWTAESAAGAFNHATVIEPRLNQSFYGAMPGMMTGIGLLCTFVAILVALLDVRLVGGQFQGLDLLISGLSGKFVSSITALLAATIFLGCERPLFHRLACSLRDLVTALDGLVPRLPAARMLADLQRDLGAQTAALQDFTALLSVRFQQEGRDSMGQVAQQMTSAVHELSGLLRVSGAQHQEALTSMLDGLSQRLDRSVTTSLEKMGAQFAESLSGSASQELENVAFTLRATTQLLDNMNTQFHATQSALIDLVNFAKQATTEQIAHGKGQTEGLAGVMQEFMTRMQETSGLSVNQMAAALTAVVHDLSTKVTELGQQLSHTLARSAGQATDVANAVLEKANSWSARSTAQLTQLLEGHQGYIHRVEEMQETFDTTLTGFKEALAQYGTVTTHLRQIASQASTIVTASASATRTLKETSDAIGRIASLAALQAERFAEADRRQGDIQRQIVESMRQYQHVFSQVNTAASELLAQMGQHAQQYTDTSRQGFEDLVRLADDRVAQATQRLGNTVQDLHGHLQSLAEMWARVRPHGGIDGD